VGEQPVGTGPSGSLGTVREPVDLLGAIRMCYPRWTPWPPL